jgi:hypothetical protein
VSLPHTWDITMAIMWSLSLYPRDLRAPMALSISRGFSEIRQTMLRADEQGGF